MESLLSRQPPLNIPFPGRVGLQQRVFPAYRVPFFDLLAEVCAGGLSVFAGEPTRSENIVAAHSGDLKVARCWPARNLHIFDPASPLCLVWQFGIVKWLEKWDPDILIVEANPRTRSTLQGVNWMHRRGRPVLAWGLGAPPLCGPLAAWRQRSRDQFLAQFDGLVAYSQRAADEYCNLGFSTGRVFTAYNAVRPRPMHPLPERSPYFGERPVALFVGRLQERKRIDALLMACAALPEENQPYLWIVGDGPARGQFEALAQEVYPRAEFHGAQRGAALEAFFRRADLFVLPGTGGLAVQEAMSYGLPVIVAEGDGTQDDLVRPNNGWRIPPNDLSALRAALAGALSDVGRLRRMGAESYRITVEEVNIGSMVQAFLKALSAARTWQIEPRQPLTH